jgi:plastocyanin
MTAEKLLDSRCGLLSTSTARLDCKRKRKKDTEMKKTSSIQNITVSFAGLMLLALLAFWTLKSARADVAGSATEVRIDNFTFISQSVTVPVGTDVTWVNRDDMPHNVVSADQVFKSKVLDTDEKFTYKFTKPGTYKYFCSLHPKMTAEIVVK